MWDPLGLLYFFIDKVTLRRRCHVTIGWAACEACSAAWNLATNSAFAVGRRKMTSNLDPVDWSLDLPDAH
jgi:hypothetical protein